MSSCTKQPVHATLGDVILHVLKIFTHRRFVLCACVVLGFLAPCRGTLPVEGGKPTFAPVARKAIPAVVNIYTARRVQASQDLSPLLNDPFFRQFLGDAFRMALPRDRIERTLGSGVLLRPEGIVVTNHHVIRDAEAIRVVLSDRREFEARVALRDEQTDLAVLKLVEVKEPLPFLPLGNADTLNVGDLVLAVGNPLGIGQTVTSGIVSALARTQVGVSDFRSFIQTDAAINQGNSGGALVDMNGQLVGINTAIFSTNPQGGSIGIGFAIPSTMVGQVLYALDHGGKVVRPWTGLQVEPVTPAVAEAIGMAKPEGALVAAVYPGGPGDKAGIRPGDVIVKLDDRPVQDDEHYRFQVALQRPEGAGVHHVIREGRTITCSLAWQPAEEASTPPAMLEGQHPLSGAEVQDISPALIAQYHLPMVKEGVVVRSVRRRSLAGRWGLEPGDRILSVNNRRIPSVSGLRGAMKSRGPWRIHIGRGGDTLVLEAGS